jgi:ParB family transcriptional regulator, chromosome partitioning protein
MSQKKSGLGKGLGALLDNSPVDVTSQQVAGEKKESNTGAVIGNISLISINQIETNPYQPRTEFEETALKELSESIRTQGIIQPITVRKMSPERYQIISGERRFRASRLAGLESVPAYVRVANDQAMLEMALVENIQRENLNALEISISYQRLIEECKFTQEQLADRVGKDRSTVTNYLRLLRLPPQVQTAIRDGKITMGHARAIIGVDDVGLQLRLLNDILANDLSVRKAENLVRAKNPKRPSRDPKNRTSLDIELRNIEERLARRYETKAEIRHKDNGSGQVVFNYFSADDLNRLIELLDFD